MFQFWQIFKTFFMPMINVKSLVEKKLVLYCMQVKATHIPSMVLLNIALLLYSSALIKFYPITGSVIIFEIIYFPLVIAMCITTILHIQTLTPFSFKTKRGTKWKLNLFFNVILVSHQKKYTMHICNTLKHIEMRNEITFSNKIL